MSQLPNFLLLTCLVVALYSALPLQPAFAEYYQYLPKHFSNNPMIAPVTPEKPLNPIDSCWRTKPDWAANRTVLADCAVGFGQAATGGKYGQLYVVTSSHDDPEKPKPGTLRYGVIQTQPLWIVFAEEMVIRLKKELIINSFKTIDGRGAEVEIGHGPCLTINHVKNVIIHGIIFHDCKPGKRGLVRTDPDIVEKHSGSDGDAIHVSSSSDIWIDHCSFAHAADGLIDVIHGSTNVTISNNYFLEHDKVILLGHSDKYTHDKIMNVTLAFNHFGPGLDQRMPRIRYGYVHIANNMYVKWRNYAIGGSENPTIFSQGNYFIASDFPNAKQVTRRDGKPISQEKWKWVSSDDVFRNGAYFIPSGNGSVSPSYSEAQSFAVASGSLVPALTSDAGPLACVVDEPCLAGPI